MYRHPFRHRPFNEEPGSRDPGCRLYGCVGTALNRRTLLAGFGAAIALPATRAIASHAPATYKLGALEVTVVSDGVLNVPLSFSLPETPLPEAAALFRAHGLPEAGSPSQTNVVFVKSGNERILIDAGSGPNFQQTAGKLQENLEAAGVAPDSITKVVFTHGHPDHLWGALDDFDDAPRFPNARYIISAAEWDFWTDPDTPSRLPDALKGMALGSSRILKAIEDKLERRKNGETLAPGLAYLATPGHTPGHMAVVIEDGGQRLIVGGDVLANTAISFARPDWRIGADFDRDQGIATRRRLLDQLASDRTPLIGFHLAWPGYGAVERSGTAYRFVPL
ncbi:MBL fold metallo-hydrolase [Pseudorhodoplanes sp.]|uniref:MBL fold metallo-hydrolase n=1 Tax=Pseudorhodoplanes sp. TaxID=1934341 RepID=UPI00391B5F37